MKKLILLELAFLFLATTFSSNPPPPGWYQQTLPRADLLVADLYFLDSLKGHVVCYKTSYDTAFIYKTTDGGNHWRETFKGPRYFTAIQFTDENTGYVVGATTSGIVMKTTNGGESWFAVSGFGGLVEDISFINNETGWVCSDDVIDGGIFKTTNGGFNWIRQLDELQLPEHLNFINDSLGWSSTANNKLLKTTNSGSNWIQIYSFQNSINDIHFINRDSGWITGGFNGNGIIRSINAGNSWDTVNTPTVYGESKLFFISKEIGWAGCAFNKIVATKDGLNWGYQVTPLFTNYSVQFIDTLIGWAGTGGLMHTADGGGAITSVSNNSNEIPSNFILYQNYPNPFNSTTQIKFELKKNAMVQIKIYDAAGKFVSEPVGGRYNEGSYNYSLNAGELSSGVYFYSLLIDSKTTDTKRMILIK